MNTRCIRPAVPLCCAIAAGLSFLAAPIPLRAQAVPAAPQAAGPEREAIDFEGTRIVFPKGEADVVERLKPALRKFRQERRRVIDAESKEIADVIRNTQLKDTVRKPVATFMGMGSVSKQFDARWEAQNATMKDIAAAWRAWSGDISELQLWRRHELAPFQTRADGSDDPEGYSHRFPEVWYGKNGARFAVHPPFLVPLVGRDIMLKLTKETKPLRLDIPLFYKPGESPEEIAEFGRAFIEQLPVDLHERHSLGMNGLAAALTNWMFENVFLGEIEAAFVERRTAEETALADGIARFLLFSQILKREGEEKTTQEFSKLFPFGRNGWDLSEPAAILRILEKLDPLAEVERTIVTERIFARNLIALTLVEVAQKDEANAPLLHKLKKTGVTVPIGGFTIASFVAAVDTAYGEPGLFQRTMAMIKTSTIERLRRSIDDQKLRSKSIEPAAATTPVAAADMLDPGRQSAKFDGLTITFPPKLEEAVEIVGPEYAKVMARAREAMEARSRKAVGAVVAEVTEADLAALRAYGISPNPDLLHEFTVLLAAMQNGSQNARWFVSGDRMQIWIRQDLTAFLKGGGKLPDFVLAPDGEGVKWTVLFERSFNNLRAGPTGSSRPDALAEVTRQVEETPRPVYPIVLQRQSLPERLDDPVAVAAAIRAGERELFGAMRLADQDPEKAADTFAAYFPRYEPEQSWFFVVHEVAEAGIVAEMIRSADRRWFCDGLANWIAINDVDRRFGAGKGMEAFSRIYNADEMRKHVAKVNLLAWPTGEDVKNGSRPDVENATSYYYFATLVIEKACYGRGAGFVKTWLDEIRKTPLNRANGKTVLAAYRKLTGNDLEALIREVVQ